MMSCTGDKMAKSSRMMMSMQDGSAKMAMNKEMGMANMEMSKGNMRGACMHYMLITGARSAGRIVCPSLAY
jgi:hypothetical protein